MRFYYSLFLVLFCYSCSNAPNTVPYFEEESIITKNDTISYRILYPKQFDQNVSYPCVIFLHGSGERGSDNTSQLTHGSSLFLSDSVRKKFPAVVIFPQCAETDYWANVEISRSENPYEIHFKSLQDSPTLALQSVIHLIDSLETKSFIDSDRMYLGGLSMGGMGTLELLAREPNRFAAAISICGATDTTFVKEYAKTTPLWIFHGAKDEVISPNYSIELSKAILNHGGFPNLSIYGSDNHNSWDSAFEEPNLLPWLFSNHLGQTTERNPNK